MMGNSSVVLVCKGWFLPLCYPHYLENSGLILWICPDHDGMVTENYSERNQNSSIHFINLLLDPLQILRASKHIPPQLQEC